MRMGTRRRLVAGIAALAMVAAGCGDDDDDDTSTGDDAAEEVGVEQYCDLAQEVDELLAFPSAEQLEGLRDNAPEEIADEAEIVATLMIEAIEAGDPEAAFDDPEVLENLEAIEAFETEACEFRQADDETDGDAAVNPELEEYCAIAQELDEQEDFPSTEQLGAIRRAAPEEISAEIDVVVEAFLAGIEAGDPAAAFSDPAVEEAFGPIEAFDAENCGIDTGDEEGEEQDPSVTELDPDAAQVTVTATEYAFAYDPPAAGRTSFTMVNEGQERHVLVLLRLADGFTFEQVFASEGEEGVEEELESDSAAPGESAVLTVDLEPGTYGMICYLPDPDGTPHLELGMVSDFTVV